MDFTDYTILSKVTENLQDGETQLTCTLRCHFNGEILICEIPSNDIPTEENEGEFFVNLIRRNFDTAYQYFEEETPEQESPSEV